MLGRKLQVTALYADGRALFHRLATGVASCNGESSDSLAENGRQNYDSIRIPVMAAAGSAATACARREAERTGCVARRGSPCGGVAAHGAVISVTPGFPAGRRLPVADASLKKNFLWTAAGNVTYAGCQWAMLVTLAKFCSTQQVGEFALGLAVTAPVFTFTNLELRSIQATDAKNEYSFGHYLGLRLMTTLLGLIVIGVLVSRAGCQVETMGVVLLLGLAKAVESISDVIYGLLQRHERLDWIAQSMILKGTFSIGLVALALMATGNLLWGIAAMMGAWSTVLALHDIPRGLQIHRRSTCLREPSDSLRFRDAASLLATSFQVRVLGRLAWLAAPLGLVVMFASLNVNIPRYFIENGLGTAKLGIYAAIAAIFTGVYFVQIAIGHAALPRLARYYASGMVRPFLRIVAVVLGFGLINGLIAVGVAGIGGSRLLRFVYSEEFASYDRLFLWLAIASVAQCLNGALAYFLQAARKFRQTAWVGCVNTIVIFGCSACFVPRFGEVGAAYAVLVGSLVSSVIFAVQFVRLLCSPKEEPHAVRSTLRPDCEAGHVSGRPCLAPATHR